MSISIACSACGKAYKLDDRFAGKRVKCNRCGSTFSVSAEAAPVAQETTSTVEPGATPEPGFPVGGGTATQASAAEFEPPARASAEENNQASEFEAGTSDDPFRETAAEASGGSSAELEGQPNGEPISGLVGAGPLPGTPVVEERVAVDPAAAASRYPQNQVRDRADMRPPDMRPPDVRAQFRPPLAPVASPNSAAKRPLFNLIAFGMYIIGAVLEVLGWSQMMAFELYTRRLDRPSIEAVNLLAIRLEVRGGIYLIAGLLVLLLGALVQLCGAVKAPRQAQP